ncbi:hypothetical protein [Endozoicomonas acroporae]|uniref:hypothetical protein n=1 Tax=Endozoicomonas acroporae TaxID=1701104 RepID=UPI003D79F13E
MSTLRALFNLCSELADSLADRAAWFLLALINELWKDLLNWAFINDQWELLMLG